MRLIAQQVGLNRVARKKSSVGICFIGKRKFFNFIDEYLPPKYGPIVDLDTGVSLGEHSGFHHYTVGQRIVIKDEFNVKKKAYYVARKDINSNSIFAVYLTFIFESKSNQYDFILFYFRFLIPTIQRCISTNSKSKSLIGYANKKEITMMESC